MREKRKKVTETVVSPCNFFRYSPLIISVEQYIVHLKIQRPGGIAMTLETKLNPEYTFENFIVYHGNHLAVDACQAAALSSGYSHNPLFLYSTNGLGKTHLLHAIGHKAKERNNESKALYISANDLLDELLESLSTRSMLQFKEHLCTPDILLVDNIQFLIHRERTQEEFFFFFNSLYEAGKQIVIACDRAPALLNTLHNRFLSHFEWGLIANIHPPVCEEIEGIVLQKARSREFSLPRGVAAFIAGNFPGNFMILEGLFTRLQATQAILKREMYLEEAEEALKPFCSHRK